ncbi:conserved hypothetical protein [Culex quinquefasciatus]|uniref:Uncharacterized protein n=1 Tax=Culex quinquefasciatus TaxID=7176 RepID=B0XGL8_CULQU|nr:conserved hypothetical protein [Culex quinquefasciatus]|eukprot:XP_001868790.1 conserved hypothetical protein [Culex quinquefasciatus]
MCRKLCRFSTKARRALAKVLKLFPEYSGPRWTNLCHVTGPEVNGERVDNSPCVLEILDTAGTEQFASMRDLYIKNGHGFIVMYSLTNHQTFQVSQNVKLEKHV